MKIGRIEEIEDRLVSRVQQLRLKRGWTQAMLGNKLGLPEAQIQRWETQRAAISSAALRPLARVFKVTLSDLFGDPPATRSLSSADMSISSFLHAVEQIGDPHVQSALRELSRVLCLRGEREPPATDVPAQPAARKRTPRKAKRTILRRRVADASG